MLVVNLPCGHPELRKAKELPKDQNLFSLPGGKPSISEHLAERLSELSTATLARQGAFWDFWSNGQGAGNVFTGQSTCSSATLRKPVKEVLGIKVYDTMAIVEAIDLKDPDFTEGSFRVRTFDRDPTGKKIVSFDRCVETFDEARNLLKEQRVIN